MLEDGIYRSIPEIGDNYEFCKIMGDNLSHVFYGKIIEINKDSRTFTFERLSNCSKKNPIGEIMYDIVTIRGISVSRKTWNKDIK